MSWWRSTPVRTDVAPILERLALDRIRLFMPIIIVGVIVGLVISEPAGIPVPPQAYAINGTVTLVAIILYIALRAGRIPRHYAHATGALIWILAPINTLSSLAITNEPTLALPLMIELATAALVVDTAWMLVASVPTVLVAIPLVLRAGKLGIYPAAVVGLWVVSTIMQVWLRRWTIRAETHRIDMERAAEVLASELAERRSAEQEREKLRDQFVHAQRMDAVGTLAAGLAHDMNNILGGILAFAEVLYTEARDKNVKADLARIRQEAERGAALTRSLLAFSRRGQYRRRPILLDSVLDDMTPLLSRTLGKGIAIERKPGPATIIDGDPAQLGQVLLNLCLNASDAMSGTGTIAITTDEVSLHGEHDLPPGRYAKLAITDSGTGIDAEMQKRIFEPFFTTKPVGKGTGLGLAMVFGAVQAHGGAIVVDSAVGRGTTMTIYIPASEASPALPTGVPATAPRAKALVLVVDDEPVVRTAAVRLLERLGLTAVTAADGEQAVAIYKERGKEIALVLLDIVMPKLPGPDCYRELRTLGTTPVLLVSGYAADHVTQELLDAGAAGFLEKPYTAEQLGAEIDRILGPMARAATPA